MKTKEICRRMFLGGLIAAGTAGFARDVDPFAAADPFWGSGAAAPLVSEGMARGWSWEKAQTGNTHPGAVRPFGWASACAYSGAYSSGYGRCNCSSDGPAPELYDRPVAWGFAHFQNSGTGWIGSFYNYFLFTPFVPGSDVTRVSNLTDERAEPGYYAATLKDYGTPYVLLATPSVTAAEVDFPKGRLAIRVARESPRSIYPVSYSFNGRKIAEPWLKAEEVAKGGELVFELKDRPQGPSAVPSCL